MKTLSRFFKAQDGATAVEYALLVALLALGLTVGFGILKDQINSSLSKVGSSISSSAR